MLKTGIDVGSVALPKWRTFKDWSFDGYRIHKGAKSIRRNSEGVPLFHEDQVWHPDDDDDDRYYYEEIY